MFFNKKFIICLSCFFLTSCGLKIHEDHYNTAELKINVKNYEDPSCNLNYEKFVKDFFTVKKYRYKVHRDIQNVFPCLIIKINQLKDLVRGESKDHLSYEEVKNALNDPIFKTEAVADVVDKISQPTTFSRVMAFKNVVITTASLSQTKGSVDSNEVCFDNKNKNLSKKEIDIFTNFLKDLSEGFRKVQETTDSLYPAVAKWLEEKQENHLIIQEHIFNNSNEFISLLKNKLAPYFPDWDHYFSERQLLTQSQQKDNELFYSERQVFKPHPDFNSELNRVTESLSKMSLLNDSISYKPFDLYTDVKFMVLNLYVVDVLMNIYDANNNSILEEEELKKASCLFVPFITIFSKQKHEGTMAAVTEWIMKPVNIFDYVLYHQSIPEGTSEYLKGLLMEKMSHLIWSRSISRADLTQITYVLFKHFFPMEYMYSKKEQGSAFAGHPRNETHSKKDKASLEDNTLGDETQNTIQFLLKE